MSSEASLSQVSPLSPMRESRLKASKLEIRYVTTRALIWQNTTSIKIKVDIISGVEQVNSLR